MCVPECTTEDQKTRCRSQLSPSSVGDLGIELRLSRLVDSTSPTESSSQTCECLRVPMDPVSGPIMHSYCQSAKTNFECSEKSYTGH